MLRKNEQNKTTKGQVEVPEEYVLRDELTWLPGEDNVLIRLLKESMNKVEVAYIATYPPTECGIATFTRDVVTSVAKYTPFSSHMVVAVKREQEIEPYERIVHYQIPRDDLPSYAAAAKFLNQSSVDVVSLQHEFGIFGGPDGAYVLDLVEKLEKPVAVTLHTVLHDPSPGQRDVMMKLAELVDMFVVMVRTGRRILMDNYGIDPRKITIIQHGVPNVHRVSSMSVKRALGMADRQILSTFGLINRGKGIEFAIEALPGIIEKHPNVVYLVLGETHPGVRSFEGETYRNSLLETIDRLNLHDYVRFNNRFLSIDELVRYLCATDVYITPYLNRDQIVSGTLAYALGCGKAIVSTPYLYAEEVLSDGRGALVDFRSPDAIANAVNALLGNPAEKEAMESLAYKYGRRTAWFNIGVDYLDLFHRLLMRRKRRAQVEAAPTEQVGTSS
ncbi:MAG: glycosyltransferase family 4 protein [Armatimonadota bacterium]|nr:glycosyltransferase family 4 protein [Armatimonadota bacterium]